MRRSDLLKALAKERWKLSTDDVECSVDLIFDEIGKQLASGGRVELRGFGSFFTRKQEARRGRNPRDGRNVEIPSKRVARFQASKALLSRLNPR